MIAFKFLYRLMLTRNKYLNAFDVLSVGNKMEDGIGSLQDLC